MKKKFLSYLKKKKNCLVNNPQLKSLKVETLRSLTTYSGLESRKNKSTLHKLLCVEQTPPKKMRSVTLVERSATAVQ